MDTTVYAQIDKPLGAAVANVVGRLTRNIAEDDQRFVYTYASPNYECGDDAEARRRRRKEGRGPAGRRIGHTHRTHAAGQVPRGAWPAFFAREPQARRRGGA